MSLVDVEIDSLSSQGEGVARLADGRVVFVPFTAPGDRASVRLEEDHGRWLRGCVVSLEAPGPERCEPVCPVFGRCGGCTLQHIKYDAQLAAKRRTLADALSRIGRFAVPENLVIHASPSPYGYRGRTRVLVSEQAVGYRQQNSHELCAVDACPVLLPEVDQALGVLAERCRAAASGGMPVASGDWEIAVGDSAPARLWPLGADARGTARKASNVFITLGGDRFRVSPGVFTQANALLVEKLCGAVVEAATEAGASRDYCLELFAGAGFLTLGLARAFDFVVAVESNPLAIADLVFNMQAAQQSHVQALGVSVEVLLRDHEVPVGGVVVLDPPRQGLAPEVIESLVDRDPRRIVYLSCDPATLARDLKRFGEHGFVLTRVEGFDLFPQTPHLEALAVLESTG